VNIFDNFLLVDLTHVLNFYVPTWDGDCGFKEHIDMDYECGARVMRYELHAGIGTHMDAPAHFFEGGKNIADIPSEAFFVKACVIDLSDKVRENAYFMISPDNIKDWEQVNGQIERGSLFLAHTGWSKHWSNAQKYRNSDEHGNVCVPGFDECCADILLQREVVGVGIDTLSPDGAGANGAFPFHKKILGAGKYLVENVAHLDKMPACGAHVIVLPMKVKDGTEAPVRMFGLVPK